MFNFVLPLTIMSKFVIKCVISVTFLNSMPTIFKLDLIFKIYFVTYELRCSIHSIMTFENTNHFY